MTRTSTALFAALFACGAAHAAEESSFAKTVFADPAPGAKARACFVRHYDTQHMAEHPRQKVTDMMLLVGREKDPDEPGLRWQFQLSTHFTDRKGRFESGGDCTLGAMGEDGKTVADRLVCDVDCDGGEALVTNSADGKSIMTRVERLRIWRAGAAQDESAYDSIVGADDKLFKLDRADISECTPLLPKQERERLLRRK